MERATSFERCGAWPSERAMATVTLGRLAGQKFAIGANLIGFRVDLDIRAIVVMNHVGFRDRPSLGDRHSRFCKPQRLRDTGILRRGADEGAGRIFH